MNNNHPCNQDIQAFDAMNRLGSRIINRLKEGGN